MLRLPVAKAITRIAQDICRLKEQITLTKDSQEIRKLSRKLKKLQYRQLWHLDQLKCWEQWSGVPERRRLGCMLFSAAAWALAERDAWIGWSKQERSQRLHLIVNNTRFLIFPWVKVKNLASKALSLAAKQIRVDFKERYGYEPVLLETFVYTQHYKGTCYKAANWISLGLTAGRGRMDRYAQYLSTPKQIFVYPLVSGFRAHLCGERTPGGEVQ